jgi:hypothetical protein
MEQRDVKFREFGDMRTLIFSQDIFTGWRNENGIYFLDGPLRGRVKPPESVNFVPEEIQPYRMRFRLRPHVQQPASVRELPWFENGVHRLVADIHPYVQKGTGRYLLPGFQ